MIKRKHIAAVAFSLFGTALSGAAQAQIDFSAFGGQYEVTITNLTRGQSFTPQLVVAHRRNSAIFELGKPASEALEILAEGGDTSPLTDELANVTTQATTIGGLLEPGQTVSTVIRGNPGRDVLSLAAMLIPTNDTFVALNGVPLPRRGVRTHMAPAYDAGTEENDQSCANIPGPRCDGEGFNPAPGEGYVYIGNGFHDLSADGGAEILGPLVYDWRNPVARVVVRRVF